MSQPTFNAPAIEVLSRLLPGFDFECLIAKGGMGAVYKAKQRSLGRDVAIKILPPEVGLDPLFRRSFETEARAMARLNHPNLIGVYDTGAIEDMLFIVMEYVPGKSLYHSSYGKMVDPVQAVQLVQGICAGLSHAHENGIIHSDIKPANILLTPKAEPKIGDFGLARLAGSEGSGLVMGTPGYTAPEVLANPLVADHRSDLFAVGVILYELLTGQRQEPTAAAPSTICGCNHRMDDIWRHATHLNPASRFQSAAAFSTALTEWLAAKDSPAMRRSMGPAPAKGLSQAAVPLAAATSPAKGAASGSPQQAGRAKPMANVATQVLPRRQGGVGSTILQFLFLAGLVGLSAYFWKVRMDHDKEMVKIAEKNAQTVEDFKHLQETGGKPSRPTTGGVARPPDNPTFPKKPPVVPEKVTTPGNKETPTRPVTSGSTPGSTPPADSAVLATLNTKAKDLIAAADKKRSEQLAANISSYTWELDQWLNGLSKGDQETWQLPVAKFKTVVRNSRVPVGNPQANGITVSPQMAKIIAGRAAKQSQIDSAFLSEVDKLRAFYLNRLKEEVGTAERAKQTGQATALRAASAKAAENEAWIRSFGIDPRPPAPIFAREKPPAGDDKSGGKPAAGT